MRIDTVKQETQGKWRGIFHHFGVDVGEGRHTTCPTCGKKNFRMDDKTGRGEWICTCGSGDGWALIQKLQGWDFKEAVKQVAAVVGTADIIPAKPKKMLTVEFMRKIFKGATKASRENLAGKYLKGRGLQACPETLWYHPAMLDKGAGKEMPAMVAVVSDNTGTATGLHRTFLSPGGGKAKMECPKKLLVCKERAKGASVRLFPPASGALGLAEGIETALACYELHGIPTWATISAQGMLGWCLPQGLPLRKVYIFGDNDSHKTYAGQAAAYGLAKRLREVERIECEVVIPDGPGDWLDDLVSRKQ